MSSIGTGYDLAASTFSPDGRIFQVEYAQKAIDNSTTIVALAGKNGVVTVVDRTIPSKLLVENANPRVAHVNDYIGFTGAGLYPDCLSLLNYVQEEAIKYLKEYREPISINKIATMLAEQVHIFTLGISRPFGSKTFLTAYNEDDGPTVYVIDTSGLSYKYKAWAVGKHGQAAKTEIEKLTLDEYDQEELLKQAIKIVISVRDESTQKSQTVEAGWVGTNTGGKHEIVPKDVLSAAEAWAKAQLEEDDMDD